jgi:plasmid maintenance system antidote protein VapI
MVPPTPGKQLSPGKLLADAMAAANISAAELARRLECADSMVSNWLAERRTPNVEYALKLRDVLGLDPWIWVKTRKKRREHSRSRRKAAA